LIRHIARIAWRSLYFFWDRGGPDRAAAVAYYTLLTLLPMFIFLISVGTLLIGSTDQASSATLTLFHGVLVHVDPDQRESLRLLAERALRLQWPGLLLLAWTGRRAFGALMGALEQVFGGPSRGIAKGNLLAFLMVMLVGLGVLVTMVLSTIVAAVEGYLSREGVLSPAATLFHRAASFGLRDVFPSLITLAFFFILYRLAPRVPGTPQRAFIGALLATGLWELAKRGFGYYIRNHAQYGGVYGALEGAFVLALWLELSVSIVLICAHFVAQLEAANLRPASEPVPEQRNGEASDLP
jgi:membrane protein